VTWFLALLFVVGILSGATASVVGFGIGSLLTPVLATRLGMTVAVAAVAIPHALATGVRCWRLRRAIDREVFVRFGVLSAVGGLIGALLYTRLGVAALTRVLGGLLLLTATAGITEWSSRWTPRGATVWLLGMGSGFFGGIAGNQGGLRAAALTAFRLAPAVFVATATASGLMVDLARVPIYLRRAGDDLLPLAVPIATASAGVLIGTVTGERILLGMPPERFRRFISIAIGALGVWLLFGLSG
jgi:hypothetical protein